MTWSLEGEPRGERGAGGAKRRLLTSSVLQLTTFLPLAPRRRTNRRTSGMSNRRLSNASAISKGSAALNASLVADIGASGLRLMSSSVDRSGALLLPGSNAFANEDEDDLYDVGNEDDLADGFDMGDDDGFGMGDEGQGGVNASTMSGGKGEDGRSEATTVYFIAL